MSPCTGLQTYRRSLPADLSILDFVPTFKMETDKLDGAGILKHDLPSSAQPERNKLFHSITLISTIAFV